MDLTPDLTMKLAAAARKNAIQTVADQRGVSFDQAEVWIEQALARERVQEAERAHAARQERLRKHQARASLRAVMPLGKGARRARR